MSKSSDRQSPRWSRSRPGSPVRPEDDVRRDDVHAARDRPGVEVVDGLDAGRLEDVAPDLLEVDALGRRLEEHVDALAEQTHVRGRMSSAMSTEATASAGRSP